MQTQFLWANNAASTLAISANTSVTTLQVAAGTGALFPIPATGQITPITLVSATNPATREICYITGISGDALTVIRAREGSTALSWNAGDNVQNLLTAAGIFLFPQKQAIVYASAGAFSWTCPVGVFSVKARVQGGGGGGMGVQTTGTSQWFVGACGGGGGYSEGYIATTPGTTYNGVVGAGGIAGVGAVSGGTGGTSSFNSGAILATGGQGGIRLATPNSEGGLPGGGSGGFLNLIGGYGSDGAGSATFFTLGSGGSAMLGGGGRAGLAGGENGGSYGGGAGGAYDPTFAGDAYNGGVGGGGVVILEY